MNATNTKKPVGARRSATRTTRKPLGAADLAARSDGLRPGSKMAIMIDMVLLPAGATESEICERIDWKKCRVTLTRTAKKIGAVLTHAKGPTGEVVYKATMPKVKKTA